MRPASSQLQYAVGYLVITVVALVTLNIYAAATMRSLAFSAQTASMHAKAQMLATALSSLETLSAETAAATVHSIEDVHADRIMVTDQLGYVIFDTEPENNLQGSRLSDEAVELALKNQDVVDCKYENAVLHSCATMPVFTGQELTGTVCLMDDDTEQGEMIAAMQTNTLRISLVLAVVILSFSLISSALYSRRMRRILDSVRMMQAGDYSNQIRIRGNDELVVLADEFNQLANRLQVSEQRRRQFVSDASHELKTPLASIKLLADSVLQNEMDKETIREFVGDIGGEADRLTRLSQKLLELTKIDSHAVEDRTCADLREIIQRVVRLLTPLAQQQDINITARVCDDCTVMAQGDDLYQIIFNLMENGIKYNVPGGSLDITVSHMEKSVIVTVSDTGVGIPEDAMEHIFERFYRVDKARSRAAGGAGLGLSIVYDMVQRNGGTIRVSRRKTPGTCFTVSFPYEFQDKVNERSRS